MTGNRNLGTVLAGSCLLALAKAQSLDSAAVSAVKALRNQNLVHGPGDVQNQFQPTANPGLPAKEVVDPAELGQTSQFELIHADFPHKKGNEVDLDGNVVFLARGYKVTCDHAIYDLKTRIGTVKGNVHVDGVDLALHGAAVTIDFNNQTYQALDAEAQISPRLIQGRLRDKLYVKGHESFGSERETTTLNGDLTTCNYPAPHYDIEGDSIIVRPGRRAIFRKTRIRLFGRTILKIPYLSIPLDDRSYRNLPEVGQSPDEGYFIKNRYGIPLKNPNYNLDTREDYMSKLGLGLGGDYKYQTVASTGVLSLYHIFGKSDMLTLASSHRQVFKWGTIALDNDYEKDNYLVAPGSTNLNTRLTVNLPQGERGSDRLTFTRTDSKAFGYDSQNETVGISDQRDFGNKTRTTADINYFSSSSTFGTATTTNTTSTERMDVKFRAEKDLNAAQAMIEYQKTIPIGSTSQTLGSSDETPVLTLQSDARRLLGTTAGQAFPFHTELSWGDFQDPRANSHIGRGFFNFDFNKVDTNPRDRLKVDMNGDFKQGIYSDGTAEYVLTYGANVRYDLGQQTGLNLRYNYMRPYGYSPLPIDQTGQTNYLSGDLNFRPIKPLLIGAQTGYDILRIQQKQIGWQQVGLRTEYQPQKWFLLRGLYTYDSFQEKWSTLRFDLSYAPGATRLSIGTQYEGEQHTFSTVNVFLDNFKWGRLRTSTAMSYNGYLKQFDSRQFNFIYDLHCAEAVFQYADTNTGFRPGRQLSFFLRIKAIPFDVPFGVGTRGQPIGFNSGTGF